MKISQEYGILIKNLCQSSMDGARRLSHEFPDYGWKLEIIEFDSLLKRIRKTGILSGNHAAARSSGGFCAQSGGRAKKAPISS